MSLEPPPESFRAVLPARDPDGAPQSLIVLRRGEGPAERTWLALSAVERTTVVLDAAQLERLRDVLAAARPRGSRPT